MGVVEYCRDLLRLDTTNPGSTEAAAAAYVVAELARAGQSSELIEPAPARCSVVAVQRGTVPGLPALVVHGHLDTVPAQAAGWTYGPFSGTEADGCLWGRGAVDMKGFVAMMLAVQVDLLRRGARPRRDVIFAYFADEEMGGALGSQWIGKNRPELFAGASDALG